MYEVNKNHQIANTVQDLERNLIPSAKILSFPARQSSKPREPEFTEAMLEWLEEADYNWADAPATF